MPFVTDVDDLVALACPHFHFVMNLGYEGADSVYDISAIGLGLSCTTEASLVPLPPASIKAFLIIEDSLENVFL